MLAEGAEAMIEVLRQLGEQWPGLRLLVLEQPRLSPDDQNQVGEVRVALFSIQYFNSSLDREWSDSRPGTVEIVVF